MEKCYHIDFSVNPGYTLEMVFNAMKKIQHETDVVDNSTTITLNDTITMTAGFYEDFEEFHGLFLGIVWKDMSMISDHARYVLSKYAADQSVIQEAVDNIGKSLARCGYVFTTGEKDRLLELCNAMHK